MNWTPEILAAHESGHWVCAHVLGIANCGIELALVDPMPGRLLIPRNRFISTYARSFIAFGGYAGEIIKVGVEAADFAHSAADLRLLGGRGSLDEPIDRAVGLLERHRALFDAAYEFLKASVDAGQPTQISSDTLHGLADRADVKFGVEAVSADFDEGREWLILACQRFQDQQLATRDVAVTASNRGELTATVKLRSSEFANSTTFTGGWPMFQQGVAEAGFTVLASTPQAGADPVDMALSLSFTA